MNFRMPREVRQSKSAWFRDIAIHYETDFDFYYLCLMAGIASGRKEKLVASETVDVIDYYPGEFKTRGRLLVAVLLSNEVSQLGLEPEDRDAVRTVIKRLVAPDNAQSLTDEGVRLMNEYAAGGFSELQERMDDRPRSIETFPRQYFKLIQELVEQRSGTLRSS